MSHLRESRMNDFVIHGKYKNVIEILFQKGLKLIATLAIDVACLTWGRSVGLRLQRGCPDHQQPVFGKRSAEVRQEGMLIPRRYVLKDVEAKQRLVLARQRPRDNVVHFGFQRPLVIPSGANVLDE